jgi:retinol dehydrogenase 12
MAVPIEELTKDGKGSRSGTLCPVLNFELCRSGYDLHFGVNVLSHFHLTMLLLPALLAADTPARVVNLTSMAHHFAPAEGITFEKLKEPKKASWFPLSDFSERYRLYGEVI